MFHVVLYQPQIPPNTGNVIRLCANTGARLHLVRPLGFEMDDARLKRAGLDYREWARVTVHEDLETCIKALPSGTRVFALTTRGRGDPFNTGFRPGDAFLFGPETCGLPEAVLERFPAERRLRLPMVPDSRSLNLSNACAVMVYEAWRQIGFTGAAPPPPA